ncbi:acetyltransferase [Enterobacteriaceae bacterium 4M9]|nr:acetyltransferase [Enterobacteriaceae bacterium 4M9]
MYHICSANERDYDELTALWEDSVRATHHFLSEDDIAALRPLLRQCYMPALAVSVCRNAQGAALGFMGTAEGRLEMLFVAPEHFGSGVGRALVTQAIAHAGVRELDVNEQNPGASAFYQRLGFEVVGRSPLDGEGRPFPLLHMRLKQSQE